MSKRILVDAAYPGEIRVVIHKNDRLEEFEFETKAKPQLKGNIYLAKVTRVEPSLQAAFIDYGGEKHGFLSFSEIHPDYFSIPQEDRDALMAEAANIEEEEDKLFDEESSGGDVFSSEFDEFEEHEVNLRHDEEELKEEKKEEQKDKKEVDEELKKEKLDRDRMHIRKKREKKLFYEKYKIQEVIKRNQILLVQVVKEERGNKGASLSTYISLAGRYCVLMANSDRQGGISKKITEPADRKKMKAIVDSLNVAQGSSVIIRTAGVDHTKADIKRDYGYLERLWNSIREHTISSEAPAFIHAEGDLIKKTVRDFYDNETKEILVQGDNAYNSMKDLVKKLIPSKVAVVKEYNSKVPIFCKYQVEEQITGLYSNIANLESGGYLVINITEALIAIDVNSGKSTSERNVEKTAVKTNMEAAREVARQLRLRDLSGLIVIDFIDMMEYSNRRAIERELKKSLSADRARIQVGHISMFGLLEMSRQRMRSNLFESNTVSCTHCNGKGSVRAPEANAALVLRTVENEIYNGKQEGVNVYAHPDVVIYLLNNKRREISSLEEKYTTKVMFIKERNVSLDSFSIETIKKLSDSRASNNAAEPVFSADNFVEEADVPAKEERSDSQDKGQNKWKGDNRNNDNRNNNRRRYNKNFNKNRRDKNYKNDDGEGKSDKELQDAYHKKSHDDSGLKSWWKKITG